MSKFYKIKKRFFELAKYVFSKKFFIDKYLMIALFITLQFNDTLARFLITDISLSIRPFISNLVIIMLLLLLLLFIPKKWQFKVLWFFIYGSSTMAMVSYVYYSYFGNFLTLGQIAQTGQLADVKESIFLLLTWKMLLFFIVPLGFSIGYFKVRKYIDEAPVHSRLYGGVTIISLLFLSLLINVSLLTGADVSRITKLWNRELVVSTFGIYTYQISDAYKVMSTKFFSDVESYDQANKQFNNFYTEEKQQHITNQYTGVLENRDIYFIHYESAQTFPINLKVDGREITPTLNRLTSEGVFFKNFYSQESYGTSSDTEFTISTSLLPLSDGTVFITDADKEFVTTEKLLREKNYGTYVFHGNSIQFWNRNNMLPNLGFSGLYGKEELGYTEDDVLGPFGIDDKVFYEKTVDELVKIKSQNPEEKIYAQLITLTNHHPFVAGAGASTLDLGEFEDLSVEMSNYLKSYNYADEQLQIFFDKMNKNGMLDNAVVVLYGDHSASIPTDEYKKFVNYDFETDTITSSVSNDYKNLNKNDLRELKSVPFVIWTKDKALKPKVVSDVASMVDVSATVNNLVGTHNPYQMGYDVMVERPSPIVFPDGSWKNNETYYDSSNSTYYGKITNKELFVENEKYANLLSDLSRTIIYYDLEKGRVVFEKN
ncbi:MAG: LTA synthase family protein [Bacilli bacterium]